MTDLANRNTDCADFDAITEAAGVGQEIINSRIDELWKDKALICQIIEETIDEINQVYQTSFDVAGDIEQLITGYIETMIRDELGI